MDGISHSNHHSSQSDKEGHGLDYPCGQDKITSGQEEAMSGQEEVTHSNAHLERNACGKGGPNQDQGISAHEQRSYEDNGVKQGVEINKDELGSLFFLNKKSVNMY